MYDKTIYINLTPFRNLNSDILLGKENGEHARRCLNLDEIDKVIKKDMHIDLEIQFPNEAYIVNQSFLNGLLTDTFKTLGHDTFSARVSFSTNNELLKNETESLKQEFLSSMMIHYA
jgi:hypothetical protein